ncbi:MAG: hypothetical protein AAF495_28505 [Pseudomonadota bacterium]
MADTTLPRGITLLDLVTAVPQSTHDLIPDGIVKLIEKLSVVEQSNRASANYDIVEGTARSLADVLSIPIGEGFSAEIPGVTRGIRFSYASTRVAPGAGQNLEPAPTVWQLSLFVDRVLVPMPGTAARRAEATEGWVGPLVADPNRKLVHLWISGVVLITNAGGSVTASLAAMPDPFEPDAQSGQVLRAGLEPRHLLFGPSGFGMTVGEVIWDATTAITPPEIVARGHDASWRGISVSDATLYFPRDLPFLGDITAGVRDLLIGFAPDNGVQLEAFLQLGETSLIDLEDGDAHKTTLRFYQDVDGQIADLATPAGPGLNREVTVTSTSAGDPVRVLARLFPPEAEARWRLPGTSTWRTANDTGWLVVRPGDPQHTLGYRDIYTLEGGEDTADGPQITFAFKIDQDADDFPPKIALTAEPFTWINVTHISGTADHLAAIRFDAIEPLPDPPDIDRIAWELRHKGSTLTGLGGGFAPQITWASGRHVLTLTDHRSRKRRLEIEVIDDAERLVIGCAHIEGSAPEEERRGPRLLVEEVDEPAVPTAVVGSYHLRAFHQDGKNTPSDEPTALHPLAVPDGTLAELALAEEGDDRTHVLSAMRVLMAFDTDTPRLYRQIHPVDFTSDEVGFEGTHVDPWGPGDPYPPFGDLGDPTQGGGDRLRGFAEGVDPNAGAGGVLRAWAAEVLAVDSTAQFVVIGRTCDIGDDSYNTGLGGTRAAQGRLLLTDPLLGEGAIDPAIVYSRGENQSPSQANGTLPDDPTVLPHLSDPDLAERSLAQRTASEIRIKQDYAEFIAGWGQARSIPEREEARCIDVYAVVPDPWQASLGDQDAIDAARRRTLVPGADQWAWITEAPREREVDFALRLLAKWDSPSWVDAQDSAPTLVEAALDWESRPLTIPALEGEVGDGTEPGESKVWQVVLRYSKDPRSRQMVVSGALDAPGADEGIFQIADAPGGSGIASDLALMMALGPALATGVDAGDAEGSMVPLAALATVAVASAVFDVARNGVTTVHRLEFGYGRAAGGGDVEAANRIWLYADYTASFDVEIPGVVTGAGTAIRYRRAGIELGYDVSPTDLDSLGLAYEEAAEIVTPGTWTMSNALARLLGITAVRMGAGSIWFEVDIALAIDLGPITLEEATLRLTLDDPVVFELRGLTVSVEIAGVLNGEGHLAITRGDDDSLDVSARLGLAIEPIGLQIDAAFRYDDPMVHLEVAVVFATAIPLLSTGLGLFGLQGRFVSNGTRDLPSAADPVQRELQWYETDLLDKYRPEPRQVALGLGATVGTQPDSGFTFNINGMLAIELPDPSVVLTVAGHFMSQPEAVQEDADAGSATSVGLLGIVAISDEGIAIGIRGTYGVPSLLDVQVPIAAWFPFQGGLAGYVRVGSDGFEGRAGESVTITVLPGTLDLRAWSYLMIEEKELPKLGGKDEFDFTGFTVGFGAGYDFEWGGKAVYLRAASSIIVGLGTKPLFIKGELSTGGELRFGPVGVTIEGNVLLTLTKDDAQLSGEFCGEVDLALIKASGCVQITIGGAAEPPIDPDPLIAGVSLTDRFARVVATAAPLGSATEENTAWVDCRPTLHFSHGVVDALEAGSVQPTPSHGWGAEWSGSARTKFLYRLRAVELLDDTGAVVEGSADWPSTWWMPAFRPAVPAEGDAPASEHEGWDLALMSWDPAPWARSLIDGGADSEGDPATKIDRLCEPVPETVPHCVRGADGVRLAPDRVKFTAAPTGELPWRSGGSLEGLETMGPSLESTTTWAHLIGYRYEPGQVTDLPAPWRDGESGVEVNSLWALPRFSHDELEPITVGFDGTYSADVEDPDLVIALSLPTLPDGSEFEVCFTFDDLGDGPQVPDPIDYGLIQITGQTSLGDLMGEDSLELHFTDQLFIDIGMTFGALTYDSATRVEARVQYFGSEPIAMRAYDGDGTLLAEADPPDDILPDVPYTLVITEPGIERIELYANFSPGGQILMLDTLCLQIVVDVDNDALVQNIVDLFDEHAELLAPAAHGLRQVGERPWQPVLEDIVWSEQRVAAILRYRPDVGDRGPWNGVRLDPVATLDVGIVSSCFTTSEAVEAAEAADDAREDLLDEWNATWNAGEDERVVLLDADRRWQVRARYDIATWSQAGTAGPPSASSLDWDNPPSSVTVAYNTSQTFEFFTAAQGTLEESDLLRFDRQGTFDTRALARYIVGFDPEQTRPLHFLDDKLLVHFEVEWIETLLEKYDYELSLDVVRTDPAPGTSSGFGDRLVASTVTWTSSTSTLQSTTADARTAVAALLAPCVDGPQPQGATACIDADLAPLAEYDLLVRAMPINRPFDAGEVIARTHFATSAYRDPDALIAALGFSPTSAPANPVYPFEEIVASPVPGDIVLGDDVALDQALEVLGLDPLPLSAEPSALLLWIDDGGWKIAGLLLDSTEALARPARLEDILDNSPPGPPTIETSAVIPGRRLVAVTNPAFDAPVDYIDAPQRLNVIGAEIGSVSLALRRSNASATRVLLAPNAPFSLSGTDDSVIKIEWSDRGRSRFGHRSVATVPRLVSQEWL